MSCMHLQLSVHEFYQYLFCILIIFISCLYSAVFDYEVQREYSFFLTVEDNGRTSKRLSETSPVSVRVGNLDDEPTQFTQNTFSKCHLAYSHKCVHYIY